MLRATTLAVAISLAFALPASAATFTVTTTNDATDAAIDGACGITGGGCSLRAAIQEANATTAADTITLPAGRYRITLAGVGEDAAATGDFDSTNDLTITGAGADKTVIDGNGADRVLEEISGGLTVEAVTITGGLIASDGAGIEQDAGALVVRDSAIVDNAADPAVNPSGGGIDASGATALIERTLVARNHAYNGGAIDGGAVITIRSSTLAHNTAGTPADNGDGGALDTDATIIDSTIVGNIAWNGSGAPGGISGGTLRNTVLAGNVSFSTGAPTDPGVSDNCGGAVISQGHNVSDDATCTFGDPSDRNSIDPQLSDLSDHGGPFASILPLPGSPLIDTGAGCDPLDVRGLSRPRGAGCDVGAGETSLPAVGGIAATAIGQTAAAITGAVDTALSPGTYRIEYGTTTAYGSSTAEAPAGGALAAIVTGLTPGTAYHARVVATNAYGSTSGPDVAFTTQAPAALPDTKAAKLSKLKLPKKARGKVSFSLNEAAKVTLVFIDGKGRKRATVTIKGKAGKNSAKLPKKLKAGRYTVVVFTRDAKGNVSTPAIKTVRLKR
jgi:CSLREA domain-containing protein